MTSGRYDGAERDDYFQGAVVREGAAGARTLHRNGANYLPPPQKVLSPTGSDPAGPKEGPEADTPVSVVLAHARIQP
jgi:hypothetical protein